MSQGLSRFWTLTCVLSGYWHFSERVDELCGYIYHVEDEVFRNRSVRGIQHYARKRLQPFTKWSKSGAVSAWFLMIVSALFLAYKMSGSSEMLFIVPAVVTFAVFCIAWRRTRRPPEETSDFAESTALSGRAKTSP